MVGKNTDEAKARQARRSMEQNLVKSVMGSER